MLLALTGCGDAASGNWGSQPAGNGALPASSSAPGQNGAPTGTDAGTGSSSAAGLTTDGGASASHADGGTAAGHADGGVAASAADGGVLTTTRAVTGAEAGAGDAGAATGVTVAIAPATMLVPPGTSLTLKATVAGTASTAVTWAVQEGARGGSVDSAGTYTAPATEGSYHVQATLVADPFKSATATILVSAFAVLDADRRTLWNPGVTGGIPSRTTSCATVDASTYGNGASDASAGIQAALDACPVGQVVQLSSGTFTINANLLGIRKAITLRGAGAGKTILQRTNGAKAGSYMAAVTDPVIVVGPNRWPAADDTTSQNLTGDGAKGAYSVAVASGSGFAAGQFVLLDEDDYNTGSWTSLPNRNGSPTAVQIWATDRAVWQRHNPSDAIDDPFPGALSWFSRSGRPINEIKEVASVSGNTVVFTTPLHISYRASHSAQLTRYTGSSVHVKNAGIEDLTVSGGGDGNVRFEAAVDSWMSRVEDTLWLGEGVAINHSFHIEIRGSYVHDGAWAEPGGGGYAISLASGSSEILVEDNIVIQANKMIVARSSGAGSVVAYNYMDDGHIITAPTWQEVGINASHMVGSHHVLFEGNESFNYDADCTHGNAIYHTVFRNHLTGFRRDYADDPGGGNARTAGLEYGAWWHSFIGNVLGTSGKMAGWTYEETGTAPGNQPWLDPRSIWRLGYDPAHWEQAVDPQVRSTVVRHGNFDFLTNSVHWDATNADHSIPASLYLSQKPAFFSAGKGYVWPWVEPAGATPLYTLPARARFDAATPFVQP